MLLVRRMEVSMIKKIETSILYGRYEEIKEICEEMDSMQIRDILLNMAFDTENIGVYGFVQYMSQCSEKKVWMELMVEILMHPLCHLEGAYSMSLFYSREILKKYRTVENLERIIFFYKIPEKLVSYEEAKEIAKEIITMEPNNKVALAIIN